MTRRNGTTPRAKKLFWKKVFHSASLITYGFSGVSAQILTPELVTPLDLKSSLNIPVRLSLLLM